MYNKKYNIAGLIFLFISSEPIIDSKYYEEFYDNSSLSPNYIFNIKKDSIPECDTVIKENNFHLLTKSGKIFTWYPTASGRFIYACLEKQNNNNFLLKINHDILNDGVVFNAINLYDILLDNNKFTIHSSYIIKEDGKAVLFSGNSGIGKSTQAKLWTQYRNAEIINGDRCIISVENNKLYAYGNPMCGSSDISKNKKSQISAIVILSQGKTNIIKKASSMEMLKLLMDQIFIGPYYLSDFNAYLDKLELIINFNSFYYLSCTPDINAVLTLDSQF